MSGLYPTTIPCTQWVRTIMSHLRLATQRARSLLLRNMLRTPYFAVHGGPLAPALDNSTTAGMQSSQRNNFAFVHQLRTRPDTTTTQQCDNADTVHKDTSRA